jgi:hypothetical protein
VAAAEGTCGKLIAVNGVTVTNDANGTMTEDGSKTHRWDVRGRLVRLLITEDHPGKAQSPCCCRSRGGVRWGEPARRRSPFRERRGNAPAGRDETTRRSYAPTHSWPASAAR